MVYLPVVFLDGRILYNIYHICMERIPVVVHVSVCVYASYLAPWMSFHTLHNCTASHLQQIIVKDHYKLFQISEKPTIAVKSSSKSLKNQPLLLQAVLNLLEPAIAVKSCSKSLKTSHCCYKLYQIS